MSKLKAEATSLFSTGMYGEAVGKYTACIEQLDKNNRGYWHHNALLLSNRAACKLKVSFSEMRKFNGPLNSTTNFLIQLSFYKPYF